VDPAHLPDTVTCYVDSTLALPLLTVYVLATRAPRLMERMGELMTQLEQHYRTRSPREKEAERAP
jgi:deoxyhypusine synthase